MQRVSGAAELLDGPLDDDRALVGNLRDLARANRWLGGRQLSSMGLAALAPPGMPVTVIDVGTGAADIPLAIIDRARSNGHRLSVTATDNRPEVLDAAVRLEPRLATTADLALCVADGRELPFPDRSFDIAHSSLLLHHLEPAAAVELLREMARVARRGIVVNDLVRSRRAFVWTWLFTRPFHPILHHDGPLSIRRALKPAEMQHLATAAGLPWLTVQRHFGHRMTLAGQKRQGN